MRQRRCAKTTSTDESKVLQGVEESIHPAETDAPTDISPFALSVSAAKKRALQYVMVPANDRDIKLQKREPQQRRESRKDVLRR